MSNKGNILAAIAPVVAHIESMQHPAIRLVRDVPEFALLTERKLQITDGAVYVYPDGSRIESQQGGGANMRCVAGVGIAVCVRTNTFDGMPYYERAGEAFTAIQQRMGLFKPANPRYPGQEFYLPKGGAQAGDHSHIYEHGHYFITTRYLYETFIRSE